MTYYDQENQFLRQRLQKEIPILTALIQNLYQELDPLISLIPQSSRRSSLYALQHNSEL